jgi:hypothetical protein
MMSDHKEPSRSRRRSLAALRSAAIVSFICSSCVASLPTSSGISRYADLEAFVGQEVVLSGYWSAQHEATGIYFGSREYQDAPKHCVMTDAAIPVAHGSAVRVSGILERSGCGDELICITVCQPYVLKNASLIR